MPMSRARSPWSAPPDVPALDKQDGYLHLSPASEVRGTAARYFGGATDLVLLVVDLAHPAILPSNVVREAVASRGGAVFPHLYNQPLPMAAVTDVVVIAPAEAGQGFVFPAAIP